MTSSERLRQAVDLYRGEVAFTLPLAVLPGRGGPDAVLTAAYSGSVGATATYDNSVAPTGVLGLGWSLSQSSIAAAPDGAGYVLQGEGGASPLVLVGTEADGTQLYASTDYRFWIIRYSPAAQRWEITREDGGRAVYGDAASGRGTVDWGVAWGGWTGAGAALAGQTPVAVGWSLSQVFDLWGNVVTYAYDQVTAPVGGPGGLSYTRATYLKTVVGAGGDVARLTYGEKAANECPPPHADPNGVNAWQDRYQTRYLQSVSVYAPGGVLMGVTGLDFEGGSGQVQYVGQGTLAKRLLMGIVATAPAATPPPPFSFTYVTTAGSPVLGTLATAQAPEGGQATYAYASAGMTATLSARDLTLSPPTRAGVTFSQPVFYFAEGYVVVTWLGSDTSVQGVAYRWVGRWVATTLASLPLGSATYASVAVGLSADTFCIAANGKLLAYVVSEAQVGGWNATGTALALTLQAGEAVTAVCGSGFAAVVGQASGKLNPAHWDGAAWVADTVVQLAGTTGAMCAQVAAEDRRLLAVSTGTATGDLVAVLMSLDPFGRWTSVSRPTPRPMPSISTLSVVLGEGYGAYAAAGGPTGSAQVVCNGVSWPAAVTRLDLTRLATLTPAAGASTLALAIRGAMVGLGGQLFRYQGSSWSRYSSDAVVYPGETAVTGITYGFDEAVRVMTGSGGAPLFDLAAYDPSTSAWTVPAAFAGAAPTGGSFAARTAVSPRTPSRYVVFPAVNGQTWSNGVYAQGSDGSWTSALSLTDSLAATETASLQVLGESCCVYQTGTKTVVYPLVNGVAGARIELAGQKVLVPSGTGRELVGPSSFVTYGGTWGAAGSTLTLRRMVQGAVAGQQTVPALATTALNDGYAVQTLAVAGDAATATVTADGWRAAYNQMTLAEGTASTAAAPNGTTVTWFFNGLTAQDTPAQPYPTGTDTNAATLLGLMAGQVYGRKDRSAGSGSPPVLTDAGTTTFYWWGYRQDLSQVAGDNRTGFYARQRRLVRVLDGVTTTVRTSYAPNDQTPPVTGLPTVTATDRYNASGQLETLTQTPIYFWQQYDAVRSLNILTPVVQTTAATNGTTTGISIETWRNDWPTRPGVWAPSATYRALSAAPAAFNWATGTGAAGSWLPGTTVTQRSPRGLPVVTVDALGRYSGAVRDTADRLTTAAFVNARLDQAEAGYYGCEPYEDDLSWSYAGGGALSDHIVGTQAHTGTRSIQIDPVAAGTKSGPAATFLRTTGSRAYLFSCWLLTDPGFGVASGTAQWELQVYNVAGAPVAVGAPIVLGLSDTAGKWAYLHQIVDLAAVRAANPSVPATAPLSVGLIAYNQKTGKRCWVDELRFSPLDAAYEATVFDVDSLLPGATLAPNGQTTRLVRDAARNVTAVVGPAENVASISSFTYARSLTSGGIFDPNLPNSLLSIGGLANGVYYDFDPSDKADWTLPDAYWNVAGWQLVYTGTTTPPAFSQATLTGFVHGNYAVKVEVQRQSGAGTLANARVGMGDVYVAWDQTAATWTLYAPATPGGAAQVQAVRAGRFARTWILAFVEELVLFYADGQQVFCDQLTGLVRGDGKLILGLSGPGSFSNLVCAVEPQISLGLFDGAAKPMQSLSIVDGNTVVAGGTLYDSQQRPQYGKDPVSNPLMIGAGPQATPPPPSTAEQNRLIGDIDSYLPYVNGQPMTVAQYTAPANGYPFTQTLYETAPTARVIEEGAPGTAFAAGSGHTYRYAYGANTANDPLTPLLPSGSPGRTPGSYSVITETDPNGVVTYRLVNQSDQTLAVRTRIGGTQASPVYQTSMSLYDPAGRLVTVQLPNYFSPPAGSTAAPWVLQYGYDFLGRLISQTTPDSGQTQYAYDSAGRLRFAMDADGASQTPQRIKYYQYDGLDRVTQSGLVQKTGVAWSGIAAYVDQPAWPTVAQGATIYSQNTYDADGAGSNNLEARLWQGTVDNGTAGLTTDAFAYDRRGNVLTRNTTAAGYGATTYQSAALYNNLGLPIMTTYPQVLTGGQPVGQAFQVTYFYDRLGQLAGVGQPPAGGEVLDPEHPRGGPEIYYASYYYNSMGEVTQAQLNDNSLGAPIQRTASYNSAGWPTAVGGDFYLETLTYQQGGFNGAAYYNGQIASVASSYAAEPGLDPWTAPPIRQNQWAYQYDALGQVQVADPGATADVANAALAIGSATTPVSYDANGNLLSVPRGPTTEQYSYLTGTAPNQVWNNNRVQSVAAAIQSTIQFANGTAYPGWTWGASNGGPSSSSVAAPTGTGTLPPGQALQLTGGSPGHAEVLQFAGFLAMGGTYQLSYWLNTPSPFASQPGPANWSLRLFTDAGETVDAPIRDLGTGFTTWTQVTGVTIDTQTIARGMGLDGHVVSIALVLTNGRSSGTSAPGASLFVADVQITGTAPIGQYGYASPNGWVTSATSRQLSSLSYHPLTGLTTGATVTGARARTVTYAYGRGTDRSVEQWTDADGTVTKVLDLRGPGGQPLARRTTSAGTETVSYFLHGAEGLLATVPAEATTTTRYALNDHLGSVRAVVDQTGTLLQTYDYGPFGELLQGPAAPLQPYAYTGQPIDAAIELTNYQARLYDPALRRFYAPDPAGEGASSYAYVGNDPVNATDPTGMFLRPAAGHIRAHPFAYGALGVAMAAGAVQGFASFLARSDFYDTAFGRWWQGYSDLNNWPQGGRLSGLVNRILHNFSRDELITMAEYFPVIYPIATPFAWGLVYRPVQAAVDAAWQSGGNGQMANAVRHVTWMCSAKRFLWRGDGFANSLGEAHERGRKGDIRDQVADRINNAIALYLAGQSGEACGAIARSAWDQSILARNHEYDQNGDRAALEAAVTSSWEAGLDFLAGTPYAPLFEQEDLDELVKRGIRYPRAAPTAAVAPPEPEKTEL